MPFGLGHRVWGLGLLGLELGLRAKGLGMRAKDQVCCHHRFWVKGIGFVTFEISVPHPPNWKRVK